MVLVKPDAIDHCGKIIADALHYGLVISRLRMIKFNEELVHGFFAGADLDEVHLFLSDNSLAVEFTGEGAQSTVQMIAGPSDPKVAKQQAPQSWRARYSHHSNAVHISDPQSYPREAEFLFSESTRVAGFTAMLNNCSLCLIKPHAMRFAGQIIDRIVDEGFEISAMQSQFLERSHAEEFMDLYRIVLNHDFNQTIDQLVSGPSVALEIRQKDVVDSFKKLCGAYNPRVGKERF